MVWVDEGSTASAGCETHAPRMDTRYRNNAPPITIGNKCTGTPPPSFNRHSINVHWGTECSAKCITLLSFRGWGLSGRLFRRLIGGKVTLEVGHDFVKHRICLRPLPQSVLLARLVPGVQEESGTVGQGDIRTYSQRTHTRTYCRYVGMYVHIHALHICV